MRKKIIEDYFKIMDGMRRLNVGPYHYWHKQRSNVTRAQVGVMLLIHRQELNTIKGLADHLGISASATTQIVKGLLQVKLVHRTTHTTDHRKAILTLSPKGIALLKKMKQGMQTSCAMLFEPLSNKELRQLVQLQEKILTHFQSRSSKA